MSDRDWFNLAYLLCVLFLVACLFATRSEPEPANDILDPLVEYSYLENYDTFYGGINDKAVSNNSSPTSKEEAVIAGLCQVRIAEELRVSTNAYAWRRQEGDTNNCGVSE